MSTTTHPHYFYVGGVLKAPTSMNATVVRTDTSAAVTPVTKTNPSAGVFSFTVTDPAYDLTYTFTITTVYGGITWTDTVTVVGTPTPAAGASRVLLAFSDIYTDVGEEKYATRSLSAAQITEAKRLTNLAYMELVAAADWNCLHPKATLTCASSGDVALPAGFAYMESGPVFNASGSGLAGIEQSTPDEILALRAGSTTGGYPRKWAVRPAAFTTTTGQRSELMLWPDPTTQVLTIQYRLNPTAMVADAEYPVGGNAFNLAVRAFGLRAIERTKSAAGSRAAEADIALRAALVEDFRERARGPIPITSGETRGVPGSRRLSQLGVSIS